MSAIFHLSFVYNTLLTYTYRFLFTSFEFPLPFATEKITENKYFHEEILHLSNSINDFESIDPLLFIIFVISILICHFIVKNGAKSTGKIVVITASMPFLILIILVFRGLFLEGAL